MKHISIKEIPKEERPYEKLYKRGACNLEDSELLAVLIRSGTAEHSALEISRNILSDPVVNHNLENLHKLRLNDLLKINGLGKIRAIQFLAIIELSRRLAKAKAQKNLSFSRPETIADYYMEDMRHLSYEKVIVIFLNSRGDYIGDAELFKGTATASLASPREVFIEALKHEAVNIVLLHNHPSGDPTPSKDDWILTENLSKAGRMIHIPLVDHIIIGNMKYYSFNEKGCL